MPSFAGNVQNALTDLIFRSRLVRAAQKTVKISNRVTMQDAEEYAEIIIRDETERIVSEKPTVYSDHKIERIYEFEDGAVVKYEWQTRPAENASNAENYNHRFTLITPPSPNPCKFETGVIKAINY